MGRTWEEPRRQTSPERGPGGKGEAVKLPKPSQRAEHSSSRPEIESQAEGGRVWEQVWERSNLFAALKRVEANGGAPGVDGMTVETLRPHLKERWLETRAALDAGTYRPSPVRRVEIPKPDGGGEAARDPNGD